MAIHSEDPQFFSIEPKMNTLFVSVYLSTDVVCENSDGALVGVYVHADLSCFCVYICVFIYVQKLIGGCKSHKVANVIFAQITRIIYSV